ncbi:type II secretion system minor pseudopilin GspI [Geoalkalibacter sp.]|uniref:type II secretion system minor pseudopilin GspI n=1 Tax=Geoalkalibacter sp. TaxID=3041440 RepID=UPI00272EE005|nr:type II secretion system minor pseudopilin GspI [Geoalkalibacter sp.]
MRKQSGFSLLEVMVALAVVAIALVTLLSLGNRSINAQSEIQRLTQATMLAQRTLSEVETLYTLGREGELELNGAFEEPFQEYRWEIDFSETILPAVQQVDVRVLWGPAERMERIDIASFVFRAGGTLRP